MELPSGPGSLRGRPFTQPCSPVGRFILENLGVAGYVLHDDTAKARVAYQNFLALWKDADPDPDPDPDIPILQQAKAEYAKLK